MKCSVFKRKRRINGKVCTSRFYVGRYRLPGDLKDTEVPLHTTDKQVAETQLRRIVNEMEREREGMLAPRTLREARRLPIAEHLREFVAELHTQNRAPRYVSNVQMHLETLVRACGWKTL